ncbi:MAG: hypothetical protein CMC13_00330 [Flavobacteriaceae bacterium]|nr:hypothetical protein [Flavobacteriaceae bacterium]|tara:strand:- start:24765 stop:25085 length:321 start_codon:yes stop_codon:yes gene_type:complete
MPKQSKKLRPNWVPKREKHQRLVDNYDFYNSSKWRRTSLAYRSVNKTCELECKDLGIVGPADVCDHKEQLQIILEQGRDPYDWNELQSGCKKCHAKKSGEESARSK